MLYEAAGGLVVRGALLEDLRALKGRLRPEDEAEVLAFGRSGDLALAQAFEASAEAYTVELRGVPVAMFGIVPGEVQGHSLGNIWFLGADEMRHIKKSFVKLSRRFVAESLLKYPVLTNLVDSRYRSSVAWLKCIGAMVDTANPVKVGNVDFFTFAFFREA